MTAARACNTGVVVSSITYGIDWLTLTCRKETAKAAHEAVAKMLRKLSIELAEPMRQNGFQGFKICGGGRYGFAGTRGNEALLNLSGQTLEIIRSRGLDYIQILSAVKGWKVTRLDFAVDTRNAAIYPKKVLRYLDKKLVTRKAKKYGEYTVRCENGAKVTTVYIGAKTSDCLLCVYDKAVELEFNRGEKVAGPLTRFEMRYRRAAAEKARHYLTTNRVAAGRALMNGWITFRSTSGAKNIARRKAVGWWTDLVSSKKACLGLGRRVTGPKRSIDWLQGRGVARKLSLARRFGQWNKIERAILEAVPTQSQVQEWREVFGAFELPENRNNQKEKNEWKA